ncbi:MAG: hypothetical protein J5879_05445 [Clostridia bacterium]|nr:hypothetical protein [Clostridia bacterium]
MSSYSVMYKNTDERYRFKDFSFVKDLNLNAMFDFRKDTKFGDTEVCMEEYFTTDINTVLLRQQMFCELIDNPALYARLKNSFSALYGLFEVQKAKSEGETSEMLVYSVLELESYVAYMDDIRDIFSEFDVKSELLRNLREALRSLCDGDDYEKMKEEISRQSTSLRNIHSITVGVNLDAQLHPTEAGVLSINDKSFFSGDLIDRILRLDFKKDEYSCISPFYPINKKASEEEVIVYKTTVNSVLNKVLSSALKSWSHTVKNYIISSLYGFAPVVAEWRFIVACTDALLKLKQKGYPLCRAEFGDSDKITGLYHPILALLHEKRVVKNDLDFDSDAGFYILTGPNQGGKSIFTQAAGILYAMLHLGLPLPAQSAVVRPADAILTHFADAKNISYEHGRLSSECDRIHKINQNISENSLVLFDEALSSTNPTEALAISSEIIKAYAEIGVRGIWTTHLHELCRLAKEPSGRSRIGSLTAAIDESSHERQFRIVAGDGSEQSYAADIARKHNLSKDEIVKAAKR